MKHPMYRISNIKCSSIFLCVAGLHQTTRIRKERAANEKHQVEENGEGAFLFSVTISFPSIINYKFK